MKVSYKILKKYLPYIGDAQEVAQKLIMHTAEVEEILSQKDDFHNIVLGTISGIEKHPDADSLSVCMVNIGEKDLSQIVCGGSNLFVGQKVAVAKIGAKVTWHGEGEKIEMKKTAIRGIESSGMICAAEEISLGEEFPSTDEKEILDLSHLSSNPGESLAQILGKDDEILEIDNKAINHRPDMFSYMGILREIATLYGKNLDLEYCETDFSHLPNLNVENLIPKQVQRYSLLSLSGVKNIQSNAEIQTIVQSAGHSPKGLLVDVSNYSLYFYGQPAHIFDADTIQGKISVRFAKSGESFEALDDKIYELSQDDIVIADEEKILALGGIIGGKSSAVGENTTNILIETAHFDQAILRKSGKRLGVRTDSLNVFEKDIMPKTASHATAFILQELQKNFPNLVINGYFDSYENAQPIITQEFDLDFYNNLLGTNYNLAEVEDILQKLGIQKDGNILTIPFWRKELSFKADIAEEIARIKGYDTISSTIPRINLGAIKQDNMYLLKNDAKQFFTHKGFFEVYNYSFVNEDIHSKLGLSLENLVELKNSLSDEQTHMRNSLIPNLMRGLSENIREYKNLKLFEVEKVFERVSESEIHEKYMLGGVMTSSQDIVYYDMQTIVSDFLKTVFVDNFFYDTLKIIPSYAHSGRVAKIVVRGKEIGIVGEIHPSIAKRFDITERIGFFEIDGEKLLSSLYNITKAKEISSFQENNFDLSFVVDKDILGREIALTISNTDKKLIQRVELFDIFEDEQKLPGKRSISFKVFIQSMDGTLGDEVKGELIKKIVEKVEKKGGVLR